MWSLTLLLIKSRVLQWAKTSMNNWHRASTWWKKCPEHGRKNLSKLVSIFNYHNILNFKYNNKLRYFKFDCHICHIKLYIITNQEIKVSSVPSFQLVWIQIIPLFSFLLYLHLRISSFDVIRGQNKTYTFVFTLQIWF